MAARDKIFLDTDVALDHLSDRQPFAEYAHRLFALAETGEITVCASALSFSNLYYTKKTKGTERTQGEDCSVSLWARVSSGTRGFSKAVSPLRSATAVQDVVGCGGNVGGCGGF